MARAAAGGARRWRPRPDPRARTAAGRPQARLWLMGVRACSRPSLATAPGVANDHRRHSCHRRRLEPPPSIPPLFSLLIGGRDTDTLELGEIRDCFTHTGRPYFFLPHEIHCLVKEWWSDTADDGSGRAETGPVLMNAVTKFSDPCLSWIGYPSDARGISVSLPKYETHGLSLR